MIDVASSSQIYDTLTCHIVTNFELMQSPAITSYMPTALPILPRALLKIYVGENHRQKTVITWYLHNPSLSYIFLLCQSPLNHTCKTDQKGFSSINPKEDGFSGQLVLKDVHQCGISGSLESLLKSCLRKTVATKRPGKRIRPLTSEGRYHSLISSFLPETPYGCGCKAL